MTFEKSCIHKFGFHIFSRPNSGINANLFLTCEESLRKKESRNPKRLGLTSCDPTLLTQPHTHTYINQWVQNSQKSQLKGKADNLGSFLLQIIKKKKSRLYVMDTTTYISLTKTLKSYCLRRISG